MKYLSLTELLNHIHNKNDGIIAVEIEDLDFEYHFNKEYITKETNYLLFDDIYNLVNYLNRYYRGADIKNNVITIATKDFMIPENTFNQINIKYSEEINNANIIFSVI